MQFILLVFNENNRNVNIAGEIQVVSYYVKVTSLYIYIFVIQYTFKEYLNIQQSEYCDHFGMREVKSKNFITPNNMTPAQY